MKSILFHIRAEIDGHPLFGWGGILTWLWLAWIVVFAVLHVRRHGLNADLLSSLGMMGLVAAVLVFVAPQIMEKDADGRLLLDEYGKPRGIAIRGYGVMLLSGIVAGVVLAVYRGRRYGVSTDTILSLALWVFVTGMIGARAFYVIEYWSHFQRPTLGETLGAVINMTQGGLVVFGAFIGAVPAVVYFAKKNKLAMLPLLDLVAPAMTLGLALGRVGCFLNGCCFGDVCELRWSVPFPANSPPHIRQIEQGKVFGFTMAAASKAEADGVKHPTIVAVEAGSPAERAGLKVGDRVTKVDGKQVATVDEAREALTTAFHLGRFPVLMETGTTIPHPLEPMAGTTAHSRPVHPAQLYAAFDALLLTLLLLAFDPLKRRDGETFALLLCVHAISRFLLEIVRIDEPSVFGTGLSISQNISIGLLAAGVGLFIYLERRPAGHAVTT